MVSRRAAEVECFFQSFEGDVKQKKKPAQCEEIAKAIFDLLFLRFGKQRQRTRVRAILEATSA